MSTSYDLVEDIERERLLSIIDEKLPLYLRPYYLRMKAGTKVSKIYREEVKTEIKKILQEAGVVDEI